MNRDQIWRENGRMLGYPECCIENFVRRSNVIMSGVADPLDENQNALSRKYDGYIPCPACARKIIDGTPVESLLVGRDPNFPPFPFA